MKAFLVDLGVLLTPEHEEFEYYNSAYNKKFGFYDEEQEYVSNKENAMKEARQYVEDGVEMTYAVVSNTWLPDDYDFEEGYVEDETYLMEDVIYSVAKINGEIVENFLNKQDLNEKRQVYLVDVGVLGSLNDEFAKSWNDVYNKKYAFYDEQQYYVSDKNMAIEEATQYVKDGVEKTYAVISNAFLPFNFNFDEDAIENQTHLMEDVIYSIAKMDGKIVENFLK